MMSLFPAYGDGVGDFRDTITTLNLEAGPRDACQTTCSSRGSSPAASPRREHRLLHSDSDSDGPSGAHIQPAPIHTHTHTDYYADCKRDTGNLRVSTLYYPGRPDYEPCARRRRALGAGDATCRRRSLRARRAQRYWRQPRVTDTASEQTHALAVSYRAALRDAGTDELLWLQYIHHQATIDETAGMEAALDAVKHAPESRALHERAHALMRLALAPQAYVQRLQHMLTEERSPHRRGELWARLIGAVACAGDSGAVAAVAAAGVADSADAYHVLLHAYGGYLRAAGLWEDLVLLVELVAAMSFPPVAGFPPPRDLAVEEDSERQLETYEQATIASGLPLGEIWSRVERARSAVHWRPALPSQCTASDPQRAPLRAPLAPLLTPLTSHQIQHVIVTLLRVCEVPLMPMAEHVARALDPALSAHGWEIDSASGVLGVLRAARRVHVTAETARGVLAVTPPRALADTAGYSAWMTSLWDAAAQWTGSERGRCAIACWRLRWLHGRLLVTIDRAARRRLRNEARAVVMGADGLAACVSAARVEAAAAGPARGLHAARAALRASISDPDTPTVDVLYAARVVMELCEAVGAATYCTALWAACCAVQRCPLPPHADSTPPSDHVRETALRECEARCDALDSSSLGASTTHTDLWSAMLPSDSEWYAMRAALAPYSRRRELLAELLDASGGRASDTAPMLLVRRRCESAACALVSAARREHAAAVTARRLVGAALYAHNAYINIVGATAPLWSGTPTVHGTVYTDTAALAAALPAMLHGEWCRVTRVTSRCLSAGCGGGGGALHCWRLHGHAEGGREGGSAVLHSALAACPYSHALHVRGATLCPPLALSMPDLMLERRLRTHALPTELTTDI